MNDRPDPDLVARAKAAVARTLSNDSASTEPTDPDQMARIERAVARLPRLTREIFLAHRLDGYSYAEIARITGVNVKKVESHIAVALYRLSRASDGDDRPLRRYRWTSLLPRWFR